MLHEEATAYVAVPQPLWLLCTYDPRDRLEKPAFLYLLSSTSSYMSPLVFAVGRAHIVRQVQRKRERVRQSGKKKEMY